MSRYQVKECFYSIQGEGVQAGRPAVFVRFAGCNLWSGRESDRPAATCSFCDTDFVGTDGQGGGVFDESGLAMRARSLAPAGSLPGLLLVFTGGEPGLQLDEPLVAAMKAAGFEVAVETNGTMDLPPGLDWVCVSPKLGASLRVLAGDELKVAFPQVGLDMDRLRSLGFRHHLVQPIAGKDAEANLRLAMRFCLEHPGWRLSLQLHKLLGIR